MDLKSFLVEFGDSLRSKVKAQPLYHPAQPDDWDAAAKAKLETLQRQPFPSQADAILPVAKGFYREGQKAAFMVGEMGVGKTLCAIAVAALNPKQHHRTIVLCPGHLVEKWLREIRETVPGAAVVNLNNAGLADLFALKGKKPQGGELFSGRTTTSPRPASRPRLSWRSGWSRKAGRSASGCPNVRRGERPGTGRTCWPRLGRGDFPGISPGSGRGILLTESLDYIINS